MTAPLTEALETLRRGDFAGAAALLSQCREADPSNPRAHFLLGAAYHGLGRLEEALGSFEHSARLEPTDPEVFNAIAAVLDHMGENERACRSCEQALALHPHHPTYLTNLGGLLERRDPIRALAALDEAIELLPDPFEPMLTRGAVLCRIGNFDEALRNNEQLVALHPEHPTGYFNVADVLVAKREFRQAIEWADQALALLPDHSGARFTRGVALSALGELIEGQRELTAAVAQDETLFGRMNRYLDAGLDPGDLDARVIYLHAGLDRLAACDWDDADGFIEDVGRILRETNREGARLRDRSLLFRCGYLPIDPQLKLDLASGVSDHIAAAVRETPAFWVDRHHRSSERLRIGYLASGLSNHPNAYAMRRLYELHDRNQFEVFCYALNPDDGGEVRSQIAAATDTFRELDQVGDEDAAYQIYCDDLDILVDCAGYTRNSRTEVLAYRPAPVQIAYHGYHLSMGADFIDYHILDPVACPAEHLAYRREAVIHLPGSTLLFDDATAVDASGPSREEAGLPAHGFVFGAFHQSFKLDPGTFGQWMQLLTEVPESVLWMPQYEAATRANLVANARRHAVGPERLVFAPHFPRSAHLARLRLADLMLDTPWCNAHTTALEALWVGCPMLTLSGDSPLGRLGASVLQAAGLGDLVAANRDVYLDEARRLARDPESLAQLRRRVDASRHSLAFDSRAQTRGLEGAYRQVWETRRSGTRPRLITVPAPPSYPASPR